MVLPTLTFKLERWKFNKDYGVYVSNLGHFKDRYKRELPVKIDDGGYCRVKTEVSGYPYKYAHRLAMLTWKPIPDAENLTVDHLDHNKRNNAITNLEWITKKENQRRAERDYLAESTVDDNKFQFFVNGVLVGSVLDAYNELVMWSRKKKQDPMQYEKFKNKIVRTPGAPDGTVFARGNGEFTIVRR